MVTVERLYEICEILDKAGDKLSEHESDYVCLLEGVRAGANEKRLTCQLICRYFNKFPNHRDKGIDAIFELCEDDDINIRKSVIKQLPLLCGEPGDHVTKVADVLTQLLQTDDTQEQSMVQNALSSLLNKYTKDTLMTIFAQIMSAEEDSIRERAVRFLNTKLKTLSTSVLNKEMEDFVFEQTKKVLQDASGDEHLLLMNMLANMPHLQTVTGRQQLMNLAVEQADLDKPFSASDADRVEQICVALRATVPLASKNVYSTKQVAFLLDNVLPVIEEINVETNPTSKLEILRLIGDLSVHCTSLENVDTKLTSMLDLLMLQLPTRPSESTEDTSDVIDDPKIKFSEIECLMYALHTLVKLSPRYFLNTSRTDQIKDYKKRLLYLARVIQMYNEKIKQALKGKSKEELASEENKIKIVAMKTTSNIQALLKDMLHSPPTFKAVVHPSWRPTNTSPLKRERVTAAVGNGQSAANGDSEHPARKIGRNDNQSYYKPPQGRFSDNVKGGFKVNEDGSTGGRGRGRGRGGFRGRGRGRWY